MNIHEVESLMKLSLLRLGMATCESIGMMCAGGGGKACFYHGDYVACSGNCTPEGHVYAEIAAQPTLRQLRF